jgi:hypothetical protein
LKRKNILDSWTAKASKTSILAENNIYYIIYDKSNMLYNNSENSLKHDKTGLLAVQLSREENRREEAICGNKT